MALCFVGTLGSLVLLILGFVGSLVLFILGFVGSLVLFILGFVGSLEKLVFFLFRHLLHFLELQFGAGIGFPSLFLHLVDSFLTDLVKLLQNYVQHFHP